ncbi:MAG TPA: glycosyltransferase family 4 protein [Nevskiales bacterium]|nr:glycosyltransferase family 4 protein [Nevskiales bacterium]
MRICLTHMRHAHSGGTERYLNYLAQYLCERGHEVTIVCRSHRESPHPRARFVVLHNFALGPGWRRWAFARAVERYVRKHGNEYDVVFGLGRTWSQDIVRMGGGCYQTQLDAMSDFVGAASSRPTQLRFKDRVALAIEQRCFAAGAYRRIITNAAMVKRDVMQRYGVPEAAIEVIYNGVDLERFHPRHRDGRGAVIRREAGFAPDHVVFLFLGSGFPRKGLDLLLEAFPFVTATHPHARLLVVGRDSGQPRYEARARALGIANEVRFLGARTDPEACYGAADVYVLPTRYDPFANATIEALASGMPVVTTDSNGGSELIESDVQGSVFSLSDGREKLVQALRTWCDAGRIQQASIAARRLAERHGIESKMQATLDLLQAVAAEKRHTG